MANFDVNTVNAENIGSSPVWFRAAVVAFLCAVIVGGSFYYFTKPKIEQLTAAEKKEQDLLSQLDTEQQKAANLEALRRQLEDVRKIMEEMKQKLPSKTEVPDLLQSVSQAGLAAGLEFDIFKPSPERPVDFYVELPITIKVNGLYHEFGKFISQVANLERIVTNHDVKIRILGGENTDLVMETTAKTYRYMDEEEEKAAAERAMAAQK